MPGVLERDLALASLTWITLIWFIVAVACTCSLSVWVVVMDLGMLGLFYHGIISRTVTPGVLGHNIKLDALNWRTTPWSLVAVAWSHSVWVVVIDVVMFGLMLVWVG